MKHSENYTVEYLVHDNSFRDWVYERNPTENSHWGQFYVDSPDNQEVIEQARSFLLAIKGDISSINPSEMKDSIQNILAMAEVSQKSVVSLGFMRKNQWLRLVASVVLVCGLGFFIWKNYVISKPNKTYTTLIEQSDNILTEVINDGQKPKLVNLSDGSSIILQPNSRISFPKIFSHNKREVYLSGEAFFEVAKNPSQPFFVYANELITKVLGTSFNVRAYETDAEVKVVVKTGRVSVFSQNDGRSSELKNNRELTGIVLTPNQRAVFQREEVRIIRGLVEKPDLLNIPLEHQSFVFKRTPLSEVFKTLENAYGVEIVYDEELLAKCSITASLDDEPLFEKIQMICAASESSYEEIDGQIVISSKGCN
jgi:transmembrane sensor